ncbi:MAG: hypothetical protein KZQ94_10545 [Candidatus Thiodiazotropha sp. (ex Troendleina suluensis)]|nr:hypothetical protein [Candidatus Thiodiazotropha sp. (ex Troendleina suluensis)]
MFKSKSPGNRGQSSVESSLYGMGNILALMTGFLVAPQIYALSAEPVYMYLLNSYGDPSLAELGSYVWTILATACVYFLSRALIVLALMLIAQRLLILAF